MRPAIEETQMSNLSLDDLYHQGRPELCQSWKEQFGRNPPPKMSQTFMRRVLAFEIQARQLGGLSKDDLRALSKTGVKDSSKSRTSALKPGGRLLREWNGTTHVVDVTEAGYLWKGETYRSLSVIARTITGSYWSGPRFFGLTAKGSQG